MEMFGGMFVLGGITATDVAATHAQAQVHPLIAGFQTLFASMCVRNDLLDLGEVFTLAHHSTVHPCEKGTHT